jgi:NDP-sugar pyrophosphorylase family protein
MHAIILADRDGYELWPLTMERPMSLLPVGNKPLLQITIEELFGLGIREATVISHRFASDVAKLTGDGERWGFKLTHIAVDRPVSADEALDLCQIPVASKWLMVRGDILRPFGFLDEAMKRRDFQASADIFKAMGIAAGIDQNGLIADISWPSVKETCKLHPCALESLSTYHSANMMALRGLVPGLRLHGRTAPDRVTIGRGTKIMCRKMPEPTVAVGDFCLIAQGTEIGPCTAIGSSSMIDEGTEITNAVILPNSYVGRGLTVTDAIVDGSKLISIRHGVTTVSPAEGVLSSMPPAA